MVVMVSWWLWCHGGGGGHDDGGGGSSLHAISGKDDLGVGPLQRGAGLKPEPATGLRFVVAGSSTTATNKVHEVLPGTSTSFQGKRL